MSYKLSLLLPMLVKTKVYCYSYSSLKAKSKALKLLEYRC